MTELEAKELLRLLPKREAEAIEARFWHKKTFKSVGAMLGVTHQRAAGIVKSGLWRMRRLLEPKTVVPNVSEIMANRRKRQELQSLKDFTARLAAAMKAKYPEV